MGLLSWILIAVIVLVAIGLGVGVLFSGLIRGAEVISENPAVQNATEEAREFIEENPPVQNATEEGRQVVEDTSNLEIRTDDMLIITTNKFVFVQGEQVLITVKNIANEKLTFSDASLGLAVQNVDSGKKYTVIAAQVITDLEPGESKTITWQDESAPPGEYTATVHTISERSISAQVNFKISE
jgi:hypothetical protein